MEALKLAVILTAVDHLTGPLRTATAAIGDLGKAGAVGQKLAETGQAAAAAGVATAAAAAGMKAGLNTVIGPAIEFESKLADIRKVTDFGETAAAQAEGLAKMGVTVKELARNIPLTQSALADIVAAGGRMGIPVAELRAYTEMIAKASSAWEVSAGQTGESVGKIANVMGIPIKQIGGLLDAINKLDDTATAKAPEIVDVLQRVGGVGKQFGLNATQIAAMGTALLDMGATAETSSTAMIELMQTLQVAPAKSAKTQAALAGLGYDVAKLPQQIAQGGQAFIDDFLARLSKLDAAQRSMSIAEIFGTGYTTGNIIKLVEGMDKYQQHLKLVGDQANYAGSMQREFEIRSQTTANQLVLSGNLVRELAINVGTLLLPPLNDGLQAANKLVSAVTAFAAANPEIARIGGTVAMASAALLGLSAVFMLVGGAAMTGVGRAVQGLAWLARSSMQAGMAAAQGLNQVGAAAAAANGRMNAVAQQAAAAVGSANSRLRDMLGLTKLAAEIEYRGGFFNAVRFQAMRARYAILEKVAALRLAAAESAQSAASGVAALGRSMADGARATARWTTDLLAHARLQLTTAAGWRSMAASLGGGVVNGLRGAAAATRAFTLALLANPIGLIAAAVAAAALLIYKYWEPISGFFSGLWQGLKSGLAPLQPAFDGLAAAAAPLSAAFGPPIRFVIDLVKQLVEWLGAIAAPVADAEGKAAALGVRIGQAVGETLTNIAKIVGMVTDQIGKAIDWVLDKIKIVTDAGAKAAALVSGFFGGGDKPGGSAAEQEVTRLKEERSKTNTLAAPWTDTSERDAKLKDLDAKIATAEARVAAEKNAAPVEAAKAAAAVAAPVKAANENAPSPAAAPVEAAKAAAAVAAPLAAANQNLPPPAAAPVAAPSSPPAAPAAAKPANGAAGKAEASTVNVTNNITLNGVGLEEVGRMIEEALGRHDDALLRRIDEQAARRQRLAFGG